ncbi:MAG: hypothetical protein V3U30_04145, partial [Thermoplasmata archaeon]
MVKIYPAAEAKAEVRGQKELDALRRAVRLSRMELGTAAGASLPTVDGDLRRFIERGLVRFEPKRGPGDDEAYIHVAGEAEAIFTRGRQSEWV